MTARFRTGDLAEFLGDLQIFAERFVLLFGLLALVDQATLQLPEHLLRLTHLSSQRAEVVSHRLGNVLDVVDLAELMRDAGQGLGDGGHEGLFLVRHHREDLNADLLDLGNERDQIVRTAAEHLPTQQGES